MPLEFNVITSREFFRLGAHGEMDWPASLGVLAAVGESLLERGADRAMIDVRDAQLALTREDVQGMVQALKKSGIRMYHRVAILRRPHPEAGQFVVAARTKGFDFAVFTSYEKAAEWLSANDEPDPDFDAETYQGPEGGTKKS